MTETNQIKTALRKKRKKEDSTIFLSSGSTVLNLACSGHPGGAFPMGCYVFFVGDSASGKTFFGLTTLAEASIDKRFDEYRLIHDDVEHGALMNLRRFFGSKLADRIEPPSKKKELPVYSETVEQFYFHIQNIIDDGRPFIYLLDSQDALSSEAEADKFDERKAAFEKGKTTTGSYGDNKAKVHSANIRRLLRPLRDTNSLLIVLNQTRDSFDLFEKSSHSGGRALKFYAALQLWSSKKGIIEKQVKGKKRQLGVNCKIQVRKNRVTGREDKLVTVPIYYSHGVDDLGSMVDYLVSEGAWKKNKTSGIITATGIGPAIVGKQEQIIRTIEEKDLEEDMRELVDLTWKEVEDACKVKRRNRYA